MTNSSGAEAPTPGKAPASPERAPSALLLGGALLGAAVVGGIIGAWLITRTAAPSAPTQPVAPAVVAAVPESAAVAPPSTVEPPPQIAPDAPPAGTPLQQGNWHFDRHEWRAAISSYQQAIAAGMDDADIRTDLGSAYRFAGEPRKALEQYRIAQKQDPHHENSLFNQAGVYAVDLKDPAAGILLWREYLKRFPAGHSVAEATRLIAETQAGSLRDGGVKEGTGQ